MTSINDDWDEQPDYTYAAHGLHPTGNAQMTTKIPPMFNGLTSWFSYEEQIDEWVDITELPPERMAPALRSRLEGDAAIYKPLLDRNLLRDPQNGVDYFKATMRPHFVKGNQSVFMWRFFQFMRASRGNQDMLRWIGRYSVLYRRTTDAWMDLRPAIQVADPRVQQEIANLQGQYNLLVQAAAAAQPPQQPPPAPGQLELEAQAVRIVDTAERQQHMQRFPLNANLIGLIFFCLADLTEQQRERLQSTMTLRGILLQGYTLDNLRESFIELFCAPRSSLDNPNLRTSGSPGGRSFCIIEYGELDGSTGFWVEDDETGEEGFVPDTEDVFWTHDDTTWAWIARKFHGRRFHRNSPKGKGKGKKGRNRFVPFKRGKGHGPKANATEWNEESANWGDGKGKGKGKGKKGKKGKGKDADGKGQPSGSANLADQQVAPLPTPAAATTTPQTTEPKYTWQEWQEWSGSSWYVEDTDKTPERDSLAALLCEANISQGWETIDISQNPTYVIIDLGCTKAMGSRPAIMRFVKAARAAGMHIEFLPSTSNFSFANSQRSQCREKIRIWFNTTPPSWTEFDIVEEGNVPLLMSLGQMRNLWFTIELSPDVAHLTCKALGYDRTPMKMSTSKHLVVNLVDVRQAAPNAMIRADPCVPFPSFEAADTACAVGTESPSDESSEDALATGSKKCPACAGKHRPHTCGKENKNQDQAAKKQGKSKKERGDPFDPKYGSSPESSEDKKSTSKGTAAKLPEQPVTTDGSPASASLEPQADARGTEKGMGPGGLPIALRRIHQKLSKDVELLKLHLKHYHMTPSQFRRRTNLLQLPEEIYKKFEEIVKSCEICMKNAPAPARSRVSGLRAENFGDLFFSRPL